jgi:hypothetical protein
MEIRSHTLKSQDLVAKAILASLYKTVTMTEFESHKHGLLNSPQENPVCKPVSIERY